MSSWAEIAILIKNCHCGVSLYEWLCQVEYKSEFCAKLCNPGGVSILPLKPVNIQVTRSTSLTKEENIFHILTISVFEKLCVYRQTIIFVRSIDRLVYKTRPKRNRRRGQLWSSRGEEGGEPANYNQDHQQHRCAFFLCCRGCVSTTKPFVLLLLFRFSSASHHMVDATAAEFINTLEDDDDDDHSACGCIRSLVFVLGLQLVLFRRWSSALSLFGRWNKKSVNLT